MTRAVGCEKFIVVLGPGLPLPIGNLHNSIQPVGERLVGAEDPEIPLLFIEPDHIAQELSQNVRVSSLNSIPASAPAPHSLESRA